MMWLPVPDFPGYEVSDEGKVRSRRGVLKPWSNYAGYLTVGLRREGETHKRAVHRLVLLAFVGPSDGLDSCHADGNPTNNHLPNLRWDTRSANIRDQVKHGRHNNARKTHCPADHELTPENTYGDARGRRQCVTCTKAKARAAYERRKTEAMTSTTTGTTLTGYHTDTDGAPQ